MTPCERLEMQRYRLDAARAWATALCHAMLKASLPTTEIEKKIGVERGSIGGLVVRLLDGGDASLTEISDVFWGCGVRVQMSLSEREVGADEQRGSEEGVYPAPPSPGVGGEDSDRAQSANEKP